MLQLRSDTLREAMEGELHVNIKEISKRRRVLQDLVDTQQACRVSGILFIVTSHSRKIVYLSCGLGGWCAASGV